MLSDSSFGSLPDVNETSLSNMQIALIIGCKTGDSTNSLPKYLVNNYGVAYALGISGTIDCELANTFEEKYFNYIKQGFTTGNAEEKAKDEAVAIIQERKPNCDMNYCSFGNKNLIYKF